MLKTRETSLNVEILIQWDSQWTDISKAIQRQKNKKNIIFYEKIDFSKMMEFLLQIVPDQFSNHFGC